MNFFFNEIQPQVNNFHLKCIYYRVYIQRFVNLNVNNIWVEKNIRCRSFFILHEWLIFMNCLQFTFSVIFIVRFLKSHIKWNIFSWFWTIELTRCAYFKEFYLAEALTLCFSVSIKVFSFFRISYQILS